ncbi:MAG: response regulator [Nitrospira sp.]|nr:response regulator [Nitrospira sp.]
MRTRTKILIVDDSPDFQLLVKAFLSEESYLVLSAGDTLQATGSALREKPALIVVDIGLPGGDGWMLLDRIKANTLTKHIPVVVVTGQAKIGLEEKSKAKGAAGFLKKPFEKTTFVDTINALLSTPAPSPVPPTATFSTST